MHLSRHLNRAIKFDQTAVAQCHVLFVAPFPETSNSTLPERGDKPNDILLRDLGDISAFYLGGLYGVIRRLQGHECCLLIRQELVGSRHTNQSTFDFSINRTALKHDP